MLMINLFWWITPSRQTHKNPELIFNPKELVLRLIGSALELIGVVNIPKPRFSINKVLCNYIYLYPTDPIDFCAVTRPLDYAESYTLVN